MKWPVETGTQYQYSLRIFDANLNATGKIMRKPALLDICRRGNTSVVLRIYLFVYAVTLFIFVEIGPIFLYIYDYFSIL
jgi:hypothetical protein